MDHFTTENWIDFVNQAVDATQQQLMERHLKQGCKRCTKQFLYGRKFGNRRFRKPIISLPSTPSGSPRQRFAGAALAGQGKGSGSRIKVLFDSFSAPGIRRSSIDERWPKTDAVSRGPFQIDIQVEPKPGANRIVVTGQLLDLSNPGVIGSDARIILSNMRGQVVHAVTNQFGEFSGEIENSGDLQMTFATTGSQPIVISLRDALGTLPEREQ